MTIEVEEEIEEIMEDEFVEEIEEHDSNYLD